MWTDLKLISLFTWRHPGIYQVYEICLFVILININDICQGFVAAVNSTWRGLLGERSGEERQFVIDGRTSHQACCSWWRRQMKGWGAETKVKKSSILMSHCTNFTLANCRKMFFIEKVYSGQITVFIWNVGYWILILLRGILKISRKCRKFTICRAS